MGLKILCSGFLVRYPVGGFCWHHLQYLLGLQRLGHEIVYFEEYGWANSCYDPEQHRMMADPGYGLAHLRRLLEPHGLVERYTYLAEDGTAHGLTRAELAQFCGECDLYINLSNINWIPELERCRRRVLVDTDPVFTQIGRHGLAGALDRHHVLLTYGENVHRPGCSMPTAGMIWLPTRQPVVMDLWPLEAGDPADPLTTVMNWNAYGEYEHEGRTYGQKDREFERFFNLPRQTSVAMELAVSVPEDARIRLLAGGWRLIDPRQVTREPEAYQAYLRHSRAEFSVAKHAYVATRSGWFSDRSACYLAMGRPVIVQDTGFSDWLPTGSGLLPFSSVDEAVACIERLEDDYALHARAARAIAEEYFSYKVVLPRLLEMALA